ncbi:MAG: TCR domain-containing protein, partial [Sedimenticola sp.]
EFELTILSFVRSLREANFKLYMESIDQLLPWFFALDHTNYSRWLPVHLRDMMNLENMHPDIAAQFESGKFVIKKTHRRFSSIAIDQCHEQNNCIVKDEGGAIGLTENTSQLLRWMVAGPEMARVIGEFEHSAESIKRKMSQGPDVKHHEQTRSVQATFVKQVRSLCHAIDEMGNPFEEHTGDLLVLDKRDIMGENVVSTVHNIQKLGKEKYDTFVKERIEERTVTLLTPLKRNKLPLFSCPQPMTKSVDKQQITSLKKTCTLFSQLYVSCQVRDGNIAEFFRHENQSYPPSLSKFGDLRSGTKADLVGCLKDTYPAPTEDSPEVDAILLDGAAIINMLKPGHAKTFDEYSRLVFLPYIRSQLEKAKRVDIVWDEYIKDSLKRMTRQKRGKGTRRRVQSHTKIPGNWESFLRVDENKVELFAFLAQQSVTLQGEQNVISTFGKEVLQNYPREDNSRLSPCTHEEADTRLLLHAKDAAADGYRRVMLRTVDTDVVVLSIALFAQTNLTELWISFGTGKNRRQIPIHTIARTLGPEKASSLLMFHTFTGCDQTSFFVNKGKKTAWETLKIFPDVVEAFATLVMEPPSEQTLKEHIPTIERFVVLMYDRTSCCDNVDDARKELFTQKGRSIENIPPTSAAMYQHAKRAAYQAGHCWGQALLRAPALPNPADWGWKRGRSQLWEPLWTTLTEACKSCEELLKCSCKVDRGCLGRCKCVKAGMACTSYCKCHGDCERQ